MKSVLVLLFLYVITIASASYYHNDDGHYHHDEYDNGPAHYRFSYGVHDPDSEDKKSQYEERDGQHVKGVYSLDEPDGTKRIVEYEAGPHGGFQAHVRRLGIAHHPSDSDEDDDDYDKGHYVNGHHGIGHHKNGHHGNGYHYGSNGHDDDDELGSAESYVGTTHWGFHY